MGGTLMLVNKIYIDKYKSLIDFTLDLGRVNLLIGANGVGKSDILRSSALSNRSYCFVNTDFEPYSLTEFYNRLNDKRIKIEHKQDLHATISKLFPSFEAGKLHSDLPFTIRELEISSGVTKIIYLFYLLIGGYAPELLYIENISDGLNFKLCTEVMKQVAIFTKKYEKQVILTGHNPALLDGLNLDDDEQRLFVIYKNKKGYTKAKRIFKPKIMETLRLSEAYMRGYIGGIPKHF